MWVKGESMKLLSNNLRAYLEEENSPHLKSKLQTLLQLCHLKDILTPRGTNKISGICEIDNTNFIESGGKRFNKEVVLHPEPLNDGEVEVFFWRHPLEKIDTKNVQLYIQWLIIKWHLNDKISSLVIFYETMA